MNEEMTKAKHIEMETSNTETEMSSGGLINPLH